MKRTVIGRMNEYDHSFFDSIFLILFSNEMDKSNEQRKKHV